MKESRKTVICITQGYHRGIVLGHLFAHLVVSWFAESTAAFAQQAATSASLTFPQLKANIVSSSPVSSSSRLDALHEDSQLLVLLARQAGHAEAQTSAIFLTELKPQVPNSATSLHYSAGTHLTRAWPDPQDKNLTQIRTRSCAEFQRIAHSAVALAVLKSADFIS